MKNVEKEQGNIKPITKLVQVDQMSVSKQLLHFVVPALVMIFSIYLFIPFGMSKGLSEYESFILSHTIPMVLLFVFALSIYKYRNASKNMHGFTKRYRMSKPTIIDILSGFLLFVLLMVGYGIFSQLSFILIENGVIPLPDYIPAMIDPRVAFSIDSLEDMVGSPISGNGMILWSYTIMLIFNVVGEELYWRGYLLPVQERTFGSKTWIVHGLLWTLFHGFKWWDLIGLLPVCLSISYVAQKRQSIWPGLIAHFLFNGIALVMIAMAVFS